MIRPIFSAFFLLLTLFSASLVAQIQQENVIGATFKSFPEEEMNRQSDFVLADQQLILGNYDKSIELLKKFTYDNDQEDAAWYLLSKAYLAKKEYGDALETIQKATTVSPKNSWYQILQASLLEKTGRAPEAAKIYEGLVKEEPHIEIHYHTLGYYYVLSGNPKKGIETYNLAEAKFGISEEIVDKKVLVFAAMGDNKKAANELEKLCLTYPNSVEFALKLASFYKQIGDNQAAEITYKKVIKLEPENTEARLALSPTNKTDGTSGLQGLHAILEDPRGDLDAKIAKVLPFIREFEKNKNPALGTDLIEIGAILEKAHPKEAKAWSFSGDVLYLGGRDEEALARYETCIRLNPTVFSVWENTLEILYAKRDYSKLATTAERAMDDFPNQPLGYFFYGLALNKQGKPKESLPQLMQAKLMAAANPALYADIQTEIGHAQLLNNELDKAEKTLQDVLNITKQQHPAALEYLGDLSLKRGNQAEAVKFWEKSQAIRPNPDLLKKIH